MAKRRKKEIDPLKDARVLNAQYAGFTSRLCAHMSLSGDSLEIAEDWLDEEIRKKRQEKKHADPF